MIPDHLKDVPFPLDVVLDRKPISVRTLLGLQSGSVLKLGRSAGENVDVLVSGQLVGYGEIVVIEDSMGVRITDLAAEA